MVRPVTLRKYSKYYYLARCSPIAHVGHDREMPARSSDSIHRLCIVLSSTFFSRILLSSSNAIVFHQSNNRKKTSARVHMHLYLCVRVSVQLNALIFSATEAAAWHYTRSRIRNMSSYVVSVIAAAGVVRSKLATQPRYRPLNPSL